MSKQDVLNRLDEVEESVRGPGRVLREARKAKQMDQIEVSRYLNLDLAIISGLEQDDYENLPPPTFTRGYIRSYSRYLELDPAQILKEYDRVSSDQPSSLRTELMRNQQSQSSELWVKAGTLALLLVLLVLVAVWWIKREPDDGDTQSLARSGEAIDAAPVSSQQLTGQTVIAGTSPEVAALAPPAVKTSTTKAPVAATTGDNQASTQAEALDIVSTDNVGLELNMGNAPLSGGLDLNQSGERISTQDEAETEAVVMAAEKIVEKTAETTAETTAVTELGLSDGKDLLSMRFTDDCWTSVRDRNGRLLVYRIVKRDSSLKVRGDGPFQVHLGNAPVVTLELNGNKFDFSDRITGRIARFSTR